MSRNQPSCLLKIEDAKQLLKDPGYEIRYLNFKHSLHPDCNAHLVALTFPKLEELVLSQIAKNNASDDRNDETNAASSFEILVENTPNLKELTIISDWAHYERWDLNALYQISRWKNLSTLVLARIPINDGQFLIAIGKQCSYLEALVLRQGFRPKEFADSYRNDLAEMLNNCTNLKDFRIQPGNIDQMFQVLMSLSNNRELKNIRMVTRSETCDTTIFIRAIERLLRTCPSLATISLSDDHLPRIIAAELKSAMDRIRVESHRPNFQFNGPTRMMNLNNRPEDTSKSFFPNIIA